MHLIKISTHLVNYTLGYKNKHQEVIQIEINMNNY